MFNKNGVNRSKNGEKEVSNENDQRLSVDQYNNLIGILKPADIMNSDRKQGFNRVHVLCCSKCEFLTISIESLHQHLKLHHLVPNDIFNELTIYSCQECQCVSTELKLIKEHIKMFHKSYSSSDNVNREDNDTSSKPLKSLPLHVTRKTIQCKRRRKQLKINPKLLCRKTANSEDNAIHFLNERNTSHSISNQGPDSTKEEYEKLQENIQKSLDDSQAEKEDGSACLMGENNENYPLDMSITSITCPFKGVKSDPIDRSIINSQMNHDLLLQDNFESFITNSNNNNNSIINNPLLSNPQTCIELIKLTIGQMLAKSSNDPNRLPLPGFNSSSFLQPQFQFPPNIIPLLLPTLAPISNSTNPSANQSDHLSFSAQNPEEIDVILSSLQQHNNILKNVTSNSYEVNNHLLTTHQPSSMLLNHKSSARSSPTVSKNLFIDNIPKNGNGNLSPIYSTRKSNTCQSKLNQKRQFKKNPIQSRINRNGLVENRSFVPKSDSNNENLFNRSFLDLSLNLDTNKADQIDLNNVLDKCNSSCDLFDSHTNTSNKSSPGALASSDKPHRQNFTSQQNRILSDWFLNHCDKPYPSTEDTKELSHRSGLTYSQVKKWFANKRARSSLNKKGHKNYCLITPAESIIDEISTNHEFCSDRLLTMSPASGSQNGYNGNVVVQLANTPHKSPINETDFSQLQEEKSQSAEK